ncbi:MAG TPA: multidrug effflux MFS transporter [Acidisphaera sp.]|nr:multidrug effflux MFS transporter [Acidisphaera sp.]
MRTPFWLPVLLGFLTAVGPVSTDMYLPAFPAIEAALGVPEGSAQITLATWFAGLAVGQVTQGTLSDRFGRRGPPVVGTLVYTAASAGCALAPDLLSLSIWRAVAAFGGSASMVIPRAVVRDLADGHAAARLMARLILVMGAAPILAPTLGGLMLARTGWQAIFWAATAYGAVCCVLVWLLLPDTLPRTARVRLGAAGVLARFGVIVRERGFITHALMGGAGMFGMFAYISGSPPVYIQMFGLSPAEYGMIFGLCAAGYVTAAQLNSPLLSRIGTGRILNAASACYLVAALALCGVAFGRVTVLPAVVVPIFCALACMGLILPNAAVGALSRHAPHAGSASALMGTLQFILGASSSVLAGWLTDGTPRGIAALMLAGAVGAVIANALRPRVSPPSP